MGSSKHRKPDRPVFIGNFAYEESVDEVRRIMERYGPVESIDMKTGFAFVYMESERDGEDAIRDLEGREFGIKRRPLRMDWARGDRDIKSREEKRRKNTTPSTTLFVVNFDIIRTRERDLADLYEKYGRLRRVQIKKNFAFVEFDELAQAEKALEDTNQMSWHGRTLNVEYVSNRADGGRSDQVVRPYEERSRMRSRSPVRSSRRRSYSRSRSPARRPRRRSPSRSLTPPRRSGGGSRRRSYSRSYSRSPTPPPRRGRSGGGGGGSRPRSYSRSPTPPPRRGRRTPSKGRSRSPVDRKPIASPRRSASRSLSPRRSASRSPRRSLSRSPSR